MSTVIDSIRFHPWYSVLIVAWTAFCHPGMFSALNGLGAGGAESPTLSNIINAIVFGVLTVGGLVSGIICNNIGVRWTLVLGTLGYAPYAAALYTNAAFGNSWFPILGALTCGTSAVFLWTASGAINLVVPPVHQRGRAAATKFAFQNMGGFIGGAVSLGLNIHQNHSGRVSDATYFGFISIMCLGLPLAVTIPRPSQITRSDGSRVLEHRFKSWHEELVALKRVLSLRAFILLVPFLLYFQWNLSYMWTWNATYHTVRARALLSTLFYLIGSTILGPVQGWLLDRAAWSRRSRARWGLAFWATMTSLTWIYGLIVQYQYNSRSSANIDFTDRLFAKSALLFILYGLIENSGMVFGYWIIASLGLGPGSVASFVGLATGVGSLGSTAAFILGACNIELKWQLWANVIAFLVSLPGLGLVCWSLVTEDKEILAATAVWNDDEGASVQVLAEEEVVDEAKGAGAQVRAV
ncbi:major facilitator superfamily domain-containing protein [Aspergillus pseudoustus]|uniref:Major facilitator superfamily domain-containing protein n=1 Tax=Aspergillus pseudoustus TaxID=1810923 RepID=A0ABR4JPQ1_9EURO